MAKDKKYHYGGQAVIEGVMIRGRTSVVTAVRQPGGGIVVDAKPISATFSSRFRRWPFTRGVLVLLESMILGIRSLTYSANVSLEEEEETLSNKAIAIMLISAAALAVGLFFLLPLGLTKLIDNWVPTNSVMFNLIEGVIRMIIFLAYLKIIGMLSDIKRTFMYHGAEHKSVNAWEAGVPLTVENVKKYGTAHVRCGTSFLFLVLIIAILVFSLVGVHTLWLMVLSRILLLPVIAALGYEVIYLTARYSNNWLVKIVQAPGLLLQSMTTAEPDDSQIEVAIAAMNKAVEVDTAGETASETVAGVPETVQPA